MYRPQQHLHQNHLLGQRLPFLRQGMLHPMSMNVPRTDIAHILTICPVSR